MKNPLVSRGSGRMNPWRAASDLQRELERWFGDRFPGLTDMSELSGDWNLVPACELRETDKDYVVQVDVPGICKDDLKIEVADNQLIISGERKQEEDSDNDRDKESRRHITETRYGSFMRTLTLPQAIDEKSVQAQYKDGVLTVRVPKAESRAQKTIPIQ